MATYHRGKSKSVGSTVIKERPAPRAIRAKCKLGCILAPRWTTSANIYVCGTEASGGTFAQPAYTWPGKRSPDLVNLCRFYGTYLRKLGACISSEVDRAAWNSGNQNVQRTKAACVGRQSENNCRQVLLMTACVPRHLARRSTCPVILHKPLRVCDCIACAIRRRVSSAPPPVFPSMTELPPDFDTRFRTNNRQIGDIGVSLHSGEVFWRDRYNFLESRGYTLRRRYHPDWRPSWEDHPDVMPTLFEDYWFAPVRMTDFSRVELHYNRVTGSSTHRCQTSHRWPYGLSKTLE